MNSWQTGNSILLINLFSLSLVLSDFTVLLNFCYVMGLCSVLCFFPSSDNAYYVLINGEYKPTAYLKFSEHGSAYKH